jgi:aminoglycoside phosphotransferase (APT) family kinase protein
MYLCFVSEIPGIDAPKVSDWFARNIPGATPPLTFELVAGGRSNLTFRVADANGTDYALRRPPISHVLATAHDMVREHRIISALAPTDVPVAKALGLCDDPAVNGAPFYVMDFVHGNVLRDAPIAEKTMDAATRRKASENIVDVLADLHKVDVDAIGLGDLARKDGYIARQLKRWHGQFQQSAEMNGRTVPLVEEMHAFLSARIPEQGPAGIVHGDYRIDNAIIADNGDVLAVLDWELCTLGDVLADVGQLLVYWTEPGDAHPALNGAPTIAPGFLNRAEVKERYAARSGRDLKDIDFYISFAYWKVACIIEGVYSRYRAGAGGGDATAVDVYERQVGHLAEMSRAASEAL